MEFSYRAPSEVLKAVDDRTGALSQLETAAGTKGGEFAGFYTPLVDSLASYVLECPLERDGYAEPGGALRFGLMSAIYALRHTTNKIYTGSHGAEQRRLLDRQYKFAAFAAAIASVPAIVHTNVIVTAPDGTAEWSPYNSKPHIAAWAAHASASRSYVVSWRNTPLDISQTNAAVIAVDIFKLGFWRDFAQIVVQEMFDSVFPSPRPSGKETPLIRTIREGQESARSAEKLLARGPYVPVLLPLELNRETVAAALSPDTSTTISAEKKIEPTDTSATPSSAPQSTHTDSGSPEKAQTDDQPSTSTEQDSVKSEARNILQNLPPHVVDMFIALQRKPDFEKLRETWKDVGDGVEIGITALANLGRVPSSIVDDLVTHKLFVRKDRRAMIVTYAAAALFKGEVRADVP